jgi:hypothetical protein
MAMRQFFTAMWRTVLLRGLASLAFGILAERHDAADVVDLPVALFDDAIAGGKETLQVAAAHIGIEIAARQLGQGALMKEYPEFVRKVVNAVAINFSKLYADLFEGEQRELKGIPPSVIAEVEILGTVLFRYRRAMRSRT